jgi:hypothetical protein
LDALEELIVAIGIAELRRTTPTALFGGLSPAAAVGVAGLAGAVAFLIQLAFGPGTDAFRAGYTSLLLAGAVLPVAAVRYRTGPYSLLIVIGPIYFLIFGLSPLLQNLGSAARPAVPDSVERMAEAVALLGLVLIFAGFVLGSRASATIVRGGIFQSEWPRGRALACGMAFWVIGLVSFVFAYILSEPLHKKYVTVFGLPQNVLTNLTLLYQVGVAIVAYAAFQRRTWFGFVLLAIVCIGNLIAGFWGNTKEMCLLAPMLAALASYFTRGRAPTRWIVAVLVFIVPFYWIFDSRRALAEYWTPTQLLRDVGKTVGQIEKNATAYRDPFKQNSQTLLQRVDGYQYLLVIIDGIGNRGQRFQEGFTLMILVYAFVPRMWWPEKPDLSTGQLFNRTFHLSESELTYIPSTQLGEFYWNFGLLGVIVGMLMSGFMIGVVNRSLDLSAQITAPRFVAFLASVYYLVLLMGGSVALPYQGWIRSIAMLGIVHLAICKRAERAEPAAAAVGNVLR